MAKPFAFSIWLVPAEPVRGRLAQVIGELARRFETPAFTPHATVCSGKWKSAVEDLKQIVDAVSSSLSSVTLDAQGIDCGHKRTTFFYLKLDNARAQPLFAQFGRALPDSHPPQIGAHLSLMYAEPNAGIDRKQLAGELADRLPDQIEFEELQLVTPVGAEASTDQWQPRHVRRLRDTA